MSDRHLTQLLNERQLWRARGNGAPPSRRAVDRGMSTGFSELDQALHLGGWPRNGSTELFCSQFGGGELELLWPGLKTRCHQRPALWLNPPLLPFAPAIEQQGLNSLQHYLLHINIAKEQLWAAEEALRSGAFSCLLSWFSSSSLQDRQLRRLHLAAQEGDCWHLHFRDSASRQQSSPAPLRLLLQPSLNYLDIHIFKQSGGHSGQQLRLPRSANLLWQQQPASTWPVYRPAPRRRLSLVTLAAPHGGTSAGQRLSAPPRSFPPGNPH